MENVNVEVVKSSRGKDMLSVIGYIFHCNRKEVIIIMTIRRENITQLQCKFLLRFFTD